MAMAVRKLKERVTLTINEKMRMNPNLNGSNRSKQAGVSNSAVRGLQAQGFTLLEVMVVMAIMAIVAAIGIPSYSAGIEKQAVRNAAQTLLAHMKQARTRAMAENRTVKIQFGANSYVFDAGTSGEEKKVTVSYAQFSKNLQLTKNDPTKKPNTLSFKSRGTVGASTIYFCSSGYSKRITVNGLGRAYLCNATSTSNACTKAYVCQ